MGTEHDRYLLRSASAGHWLACLDLLDRGANIEAMDERGRNSLGRAALNGHTQTCLALLDRGADIEASNDRQKTALSRAALNGHTETCLALLDRGADIEARDVEGQTPLDRAAVNGHTQTCLALLDRGANIETKDADQKTALHRASQGGRRQTCLALLARRASPIGIRNANGDVPRLMTLTPLGAAAELDDVSEMIRVLQSEPQEGLDERLTSAIEAAAQTRTQPGPAVLKGWLDARRAMAAIDQVVAQKTWGRRERGIERSAFQCGEGW